jgi:hypothetical protein
MMSMVQRRLAIAASIATFVAVVGCGGEPLGGHQPVATGGTGMTASGGRGAGPGGELGSGGAGGGPFCGESTNVIISPPVPPDILILMDRSSSLNDDASEMACSGGCGPGSKWALLSAAIDNLVTANNSVNWGLMLYGADDACGAPTAPTVAVGSNAGSSITSALGAALPGGEAPTASAISSAVAYLQSVGDVSPKYILLVTDGRSGCGSDGVAVDLAAENAVATAEAEGFPTFVLGMAPATDTTALAALNQMAINGAESLQGGANAFYTTADIGMQLAPTTALASSCTMPLVGPLGPDTALVVSVTGSDGSTTLIPENQTDGWSFTDSTLTSITFHGSSCSDEWDGTDRQITIVYTCPEPPLLP